MNQRRGYDALRQKKLYQFEPPAARQEGMWNLRMVIVERLLCVRDLARLLVAIGTLDVEKALAKVAEWKRLEAMYTVDAQLEKRPLVRYVRERSVT